MKKGTLFALLMVFVIISFVACSDKDDDVVDTTAVVQIRDNTTLNEVAKDVYYKGTDDLVWKQITSTKINMGETIEIKLPIGETFEFMIQHKVGNTGLNSDIVTRFIFPGYFTVDAEDNLVSISQGHLFANPRIDFVNATDPKKTVTSLRLFHRGAGANNYFFERLGDFTTSPQITLNLLHKDDIYELQITFSDGGTTGREELVINKDGRFYFDSAGVIPPPA